MKRVVIVDFDVHHGNGTEATFRDDPSVLFVSLHQWPFYPGTGGPGTSDEHTLNLPLAAGAGDGDYARAFRDAVEPAVRAFDPELVLVSAGFDAHERDPLGGMRLTVEGFRELARRCSALAPKTAAVLEGGYNVETLPSLVEAALEGFSERLAASGLEALERLAPRGDAELLQEALHVRANRVLRDVQALGDLVRPQVLVEQEQHLDLARRERARDRFRDPVETAALADPVQEPARHASGERSLSADDSAQERRDLLRRFRLQEIAGRAAADRRKEVLLGVGGSQHDDLALGRLGADLRERGQAVHSRHRQVEEHQVGLAAARSHDCLFAAGGVAYHLEPLLREQRGQGVSRQRVVVDDQDSLRHVSLIGRGRAAEKGVMDHLRSQSYRSWLFGEIMLVGLLASATALFTVSSSLQSAYELPEARLVLDTVVAGVAVIVAVLSAIRFLVDGRTLDLLLAAGFLAIALGTVTFGLLPILGGDPMPPWAAWALVGARLLGAALIAVAPFANGRMSRRRTALLAGGVGVVAVLASIGFGTSRWSSGTEVSLVEGSAVELAAALLAALWLVAVVGFGLRYHRHGRDLDAWLCLAATLALFADLHLLLTPIVSSEHVLQGDFLRVVAFGFLLVGVWRAVADAEFGRAVADERARVAREIHDGLAQYLFAISTQVSMLESDAPLEQVLPRLKQASTAAQQEARFAVLALSSAGGSARFDSALRRYIDVLTADGDLDVELEVDRQVRLAPDEQIEVFRIVQEGLGNVRRHADARHADVSIAHRGGRRVVSVSDDGVGFDEDVTAAGQGLDNIRLRAEAIEGELNLRSAPGRGTAIEVVLRPT